MQSQLLAKPGKGFLLFSRPILLRTVAKNDPVSPTNVDALAGMAATVVSDFVKGQGTVKLRNGETCTARTNPLSALADGDQVSVVRVDGATAVVEPVSVREWGGKLMVLGQLIQQLFVVALVIVLVVFAVVVVARSVRVVPQAFTGIVERLGRYRVTLGPGLNILVPFIDRLLPLVDLREKVVSFPPQPVITEDNLVLSIDTVVFFQVTDAKSATYEIQDYLQGVEQLTSTTLRNVVGGLTSKRH